MGWILLMLANYFHDLSVAIMTTNIIVVTVVGRYLDRHPGHDLITAHLFRVLSRVTTWALVYVILGGILRAWFFKEFEWVPAAGRGQVAALMVKHIILVSLTVAGFIVHRRYLRKYNA